MQQDLLKVFKALSDDTRLEILKEIAKHDEICVCKLTETFTIAQSKLSYHLKLLLDARIINVKPQGKWNFYSVNIDFLRKILSKETLNFLKK